MGNIPNTRKSQLTFNLARWSLLEIDSFQFITIHCASASFSRPILENRRKVTQATARILFM
jgi:hypothetical protein